MKKVAVFGLGLAYKQYYNLISAKYEIIVLLDSDITKQGVSFAGLKCIKPTDVSNYEIDAVVITPIWKNSRREMSELIKKLLPNLEILFLEDCIPPLFAKEAVLGAVEYCDDFYNKVIVDGGAYINRMCVEFEGTHNYIHIHKNVRVRDTIRIHCGGSKNVLEIGEDTSIVAANFDIAEQGKIIVGRDCMFSWDIDFMQNANHPVYDMQKGVRKNCPRNILIGEHVWIGKRVGLLPGTNIGKGSIVGYGSVTTKKYNEFSTIVGNPAKEVCQNVCWKRDVVGFYNLDKLETFNEDSV